MGGPTTTELVALVCCDLGAIVRGRALPAAELDAHLAAGVGWVPANHSLTPLGPLAEPNPFGPIGDLRLLPDQSTRARVAGDPAAGAGPLDMVLCDIVDTDGRPWQCCARHWLADAVDQLAREHGLRAIVSFEHEFQLRPHLHDEPASPSARDLRSPPTVEGSRATEATAATSASTPAPAPASPAASPPGRLPAGLPFSLEALRTAEPFAAAVMGALSQAGAQPERIFAEYAPCQFEIPVRPAAAVAAADRSVVLTQVVRDIARRCGLRATFTPLLEADQAGNGVHVHLALLDEHGGPALYDAARPGCLSELGERFAAGILAHAPALMALTAPSPVSAARLGPHRWSAGAVCVGQRNREVVLRLPPLVALGDVPPARQLRLEYRAADATANPYLALGAILRAGMHGLRAGLAAPPILDRDPAELDRAEAARYGVGGLPGSQQDALRALAEDPIVRDWMTPLMFEAYVGVRRAELQATADWDIGQLTRRYAEIY